MSTNSLRRWFDEALRARLASEAFGWYEAARDEIGAGVPDRRFCALLSTASRHARRRALAPDVAERAAARELVPGWETERWSLLETLRVGLVLAREDLAQQSAVDALEEAFRFADEGELCALYKSLGLLPDPERFAWRGGEGCRSNMRTVFESVACDSPFAASAFDELAWNQLCIKAIFVGAPLHRVHGLDARLSPELARMALDLVEERRSAGRPVPPELWLCVGAHGGARGLAAMEAELAPANSHRVGRRAAALALARAGETGRLRALVEREADVEVQATMRSALAGKPEPRAFAALAAPQ